MTEQEMQKMFGVTTGTMAVTSDDTLMLQGMIQFANDMSGGRANTRRIQEFKTRLDAALLRATESANTGEAV